MALSKRQAVEVNQRRWRIYSNYQAMLTAGAEKWEAATQLALKEEVSPSTVYNDIKVVEKIKAAESVNE